LGVLLRRRDERPPCRQILVEPVTGLLGSHPPILHPWRLPGPPPRTAQPPRNLTRAQSPAPPAPHIFVIMTLLLLEAQQSHDHERQVPAGAGAWRICGRRLRLCVQG